MGQKYDIKRYEPLSFLLFLGGFSMLSILLFSLLKFWRSIKTGLVIAPRPGVVLLIATVILILGLLLLLASSYFFKNQKFSTFRVAFGASLVAHIVFFGVQITNLPLERAGDNPSKLGYYYVAFLIGLHLLFLLIGMVAQGVMLSKINEKTDYLNTFIFSVNPPNILNMNLLIKFMSIVTMLWLLIILFLTVYAA